MEPKNESKTNWSTHGDANFFVASKNDPLYRFIAQFSKSTPVYTGILYFLVSFVGVYIIGLVTGQYHGKNGLPPMYSQILDNINLGFLAPVGAGLLCNLYNTIGFSLKRIKEENLIETVEADKYKIFLSKADKLYNNWWPFIISCTLALGINLYNYLTKTTSWLAINGGITGIYGRIFITIDYTIIFLVIYKYFITIWALHHLFGNFNVRISPIHPDRSGGLKPFGDLAISANYFMALIVIFITLILVFDPFSRKTSMYFYMLIVSYPIAILSFFLSLSKAHVRMNEKKREVIAMLGKTFDFHYEKLKKTEKNNIYDLKEVDQISNLETLYNIAQKMPVWPFDANTMQRFLTSFAIPVVIFLLDRFKIMDSFINLIAH